MKHAPAWGGSLSLSKGPFRERREVSARPPVVDRPASRAIRVRRASAVKIVRALAAADRWIVRRDWAHPIAGSRVSRETCQAASLPPPPTPEPVGRDRASQAVLTSHLDSRQQGCLAARNISVERSGHCGALGGRVAESPKGGSAPRSSAAPVSRETRSIVSICTYVARELIEGSRHTSLLTRLASPSVVLRRLCTKLLARTQRSSSPYWQPCPANVPGERECLPTSHAACASHDKGADAALRLALGP